MPGALRVKLPDGTWYGVAEGSEDSDPKPAGTPALTYRGIDLRVKTATGWSGYIAPDGYGERWWPGWGAWSDFPPYTRPEPVSGVRLGIRTDTPPWFNAPPAMPGGFGYQVGQEAPEHNNPLLARSLTGQSAIDETRQVTVYNTDGSTAQDTVTTTTAWAPGPDNVILTPAMDASSKVTLTRADAAGGVSRTVDDAYQTSTVGPFWYYDAATVPKFSRHRWVRSGRVWGSGHVTGSITVGGTTTAADLAAVDLTITLTNIGSWSGNAAAILAASGGTGDFVFVSDPFTWQPLTTDARVYVTDAPDPPDPATSGSFGSNTSQVSVSVGTLIVETLSTDGTPDPDQPFPPGARL